MNWYKKAWGVQTYELDHTGPFDSYVMRGGRELEVQVTATVSGYVTTYPYLETEEEGYAMTTDIQELSIYVEPVASFEGQKIELTDEEIAAAEESIRITVEDNPDDFTGQELFT